MSSSIHSTLDNISNFLGAIRVRNGRRRDFDVGIVGFDTLELVEKVARKADGGWVAGENIAETFFKRGAVAVAHVQRVDRDTYMQYS